jgi:hypothetical protein
MTFGPMQVRTGMNVVDRQGAQIGRVGEVGEQQFATERGQHGVIAVS